MTIRPLIAALVLALGCLAAVAMGATPNFVMHGQFSPEFIAKAEQQAEHCRKTLAIEWLGGELPNWSKPCMVELVPASGAGGSTFYGFQDGRAFDFEGKWQGPEADLLANVIPHEVLHTVLASQFGQVPRWADEGAAMNAELNSQDNGRFQDALLDRLYRTQAFKTSDLMQFKEYPNDFVCFYGQSYSLAKFLIQHNGKPGFAGFIGDVLRHRDYEAALADNYGIATVLDLQNSWLSWLEAGQPLSPDQLGVRSVSYQAGRCRYVWNGRGWVQQCEQPLQYQPIVRPVQPPAPLQPVPPKPQQHTCKSCTCDSAALIARITKLEAELLLIKNTKPIPGPQGPRGEQGPAGPAGAPGKDAQPPAIEQIISKIPSNTLEMWENGKLVDSLEVPIGGRIPLVRDSGVKVK